MIRIDGGYGEGGGQIVRTALALSLVTSKPFSIDNIRANRPKPGLMRQHLTAVNAAARVGNARVQGNTLGSGTFTFEPGPVEAGKYHFDVGSAGSCTLVLQTILPALLRADGPSELVLTGGTHNPWAPPFDFLQKSFVPLINRMGAALSTGLERPGFYPAGGGRIRASVHPAPGLKPIELPERGRVLSHKASAMVSHLPLSIARRELKVVADKLQWPEQDLAAVDIKTAKGPGNVLMLEVQSEALTEIFTGFGRRGVPAETVAGRAVASVLEYMSSGAPVGRYLADQLLIPLAMAGGGEFRTLSPSGHTTTNIGVIKQFLDVKIQLNACNEDLWRVAINPSPASRSSMESTDAGQSVDHRQNRPYR